MNLYKFATIDMKEFYTSIKECHKCCWTTYEISGKDKAIIFDARKCVLFNDQNIWIKKKGELFDVTIGAFDRAEVFKEIFK